jgi:hypothetical protein
MDTLLEWGVVQAGDIIMAKDHNDEVTLLSNGNVKMNGVEQSMQKWLKEIYGMVGQVFKPMCLQYINKLANPYQKSMKCIWTI